MSFPPVAIVGQACLLPGALDPGELWSAVLAGRDLLSHLPEGRWRIDPSRVLGGSPEDSADRSWSDRGGYVEGFDPVFDPAGFALPAEQVAGLDPLFLWTLHTAREALRDAGCGIRSPGHDRAGLILGNLSFPSGSLTRWYEAVWLELHGARIPPAGLGDVPDVERPDPRNRFMSGLPAHLAARALGLAAPSFALDAACASSLYAIKLACDRLHDGRADLMVAGAVNRADVLFIHVGFCALRALSQSGRSRPFHRRADGLVPAEGAAFVVLKRLADALTAGDRILGVIRGIGLSNDGRGSGLLAPSEDGQERAMQRAYAMSGLKPADVSLLECHATGTPVGDATEIRSMGRVFAGLRDVPIGSIKSNLGHPITVAGAAGLLKVLAAFREGVRPPTRDADDPAPELAESPFRLIAAAERWNVTGPRRAAVSAFGFGGNNAHLLVEDAPTGELRATASARVAVGSPTPDTPHSPVAVVGLGAVVADGRTAVDFARALFTGETKVRPQPDRPADHDLAGFATDVVLDGRTLRFPPRDLEHTLPQQLLVLNAVLEATAQVESLPGETTAVLVGMQCDARVARFGVRVRLDEWTRQRPGAETPAFRSWLAGTRDAISEAIDAAGVVGTMPNIPANRLNSQLDLTAPGFTVSAEELSGIVALDLAARALGAGEIDAAVVGAVDVCSEEVHAQAAREVLDEERRIPGDAAVAVVVKRLADARRDGDRIYAVLPESPSYSTPPAADTSPGGPTSEPAAAQDAAVDLRLAIGGDAPGLAPLFGHAHAASGLLHVAAAALACRYRARPFGRDGGTVPWLEPRSPRSAGVAVSALGGASATVHLISDVTHEPLLLERPPRLHVFAGADRAEVLERARLGRESDDGPARLVLVAADSTELKERAERALRLLTDSSKPAASVAEAGIRYRERPVGGELAFVFTGPAGAYPGMGRELALALPELIDSLTSRFDSFHDAAGWVYAAPADREPLAEEKLWGASMLCQLQAQLSRDVLGLSPQAAIGFSSGETNALYALGAWRDLDGLCRDIREVGLYTRELAGDLDTVRRAWGTRQPVQWAQWRVLAPMDDVYAALVEERRVHMITLNAPGDQVIGGDAEACERLVDRLGRRRCRRLGYDFAIHCPEVHELRHVWRALHRRQTFPVPGVRFYTHATCDHYEPTEERAADALLEQALKTVDFPALIDKAWNDGVRVFVEHGPRDGCSRWIRRILGDREHVSVALDAAGRSSVRQVMDALAEVVAAGVAVDHRALESRLAAATLRDLDAPQGHVLRFPVHRPSLPLPPLPATESVDSETAFSETASAETASAETASAETASAEIASAETLADAAQTGATIDEDVQVMAPAPWLPPVLETGNGARKVPLEIPETVAPETVAPETVAPETVAPETVAPRTVAPKTVVPKTVTPKVAPVPPATAPGGASHTSVSSVAPAAAPMTPMPAATPSGVPETASTALEALAAHQRHLAEAHRGFLQDQEALHHRFLAFRASLVQSLAQLAGAEPMPAASGPTQEAAVIPAGAPAAPEPAIPAATAEPAAETGRPVRPDTLTPPAAAPPEPRAPEPPALATPASEPVAEMPPADSFPGLKISRQQLEVLASGKVSEIFGPLFEQQDAYERQVRMPEPPLLLADRVIGIDAEPGTLGTGTLWTETDVDWDSWYLHEGHMPLGLWIEAGQADLLLISWLGIDFLNRGERVYRLLGCDLTYHGGGLPRPGETLRYDIHVDGHAQQGDVRLFFFHYDCKINGKPRLTVRGGQAGFFTEQELAESAGVLWTPDDAELTPRQVDPPIVPDVPSSLSREDLVAFSEGRIFDAFGPGFEFADTHVRPPRIPSGRLLMLDEITHLDPQGGPWKRGYLRTATHLSSDDWFLGGHFKNDPCMPGTLMLEACLEAAAVYLTALGFTLDKDGWEFEPVPEEAYKLRCRGQAIPTSKLMVCELFIEEVVAAPYPTVFADFLGTVDGLKAFHCRRAGLRLVPGWPLTSRPELLAGHEDPEPVALVDGFSFGYASLLSCAWGRPSEAFGKITAAFDGHRRLPRLPSPPYHFMSRVTRIDGPIGVVEPGTEVDVRYDVPPDEWYFEENGHRTMPWAVFLEVNLQPCGWLAVATGVCNHLDEDVSFRNLDGTVTWKREVLPDAGTLCTRVKLTNISRSAGMVIVSFDVDCLLGEVSVCQLQTVFGFFPKAALAAQAGLPVGDEERAWLARPSDFHVDLETRPCRYCGGEPRLAGPMLRMIDRVTGYWPEAGAAGLGRLRAEKDIVPGEWFFKAHFFQDPVQPGSVGLEAMVQLVQFYMIERGLAEGMDHPRFEPLMLGRPHTWKYRGQVLPKNRLVTVEAEITEQGRDESGPFVVADAWLWVDGLRIYSATNLGMRVVEGGVPPPVAAAAQLTATAKPSAAAEPDDEPVDPAPAVAFWSQRSRVSDSLIGDVFTGLIRRFVHRFSLAKASRRAELEDRNLLFLANHQVGIESLLFALLGAGFTGRPIVAIAKAEHRQTWLGHLAELTAGYPGIVDPAPMVFFERDDQAALLKILDELKTRMAAEGCSVLVHVEGTRSLSCRQPPVSRMSSVWVDLALATGAPIVPVRFYGGLPVDELPARLEFPVGYGRQDYYLGDAIQADDLRELTLPERNRRILAAINSLGPTGREESAVPGDPDFAEAVEARRRATGTSETRAVLLEVLERLARPSAETRALIEVLSTNRLAGEHGLGPAQLQWLRDVVRWFSKDRAPG